MTDATPLNNNTDESPRIVIAGHSHMVALTGDLPASPPGLTPLVNFSSIYALHGLWPRTGEYWGKLSECARDSRIAIVWGGNEHNIAFFFETSQPFDFVSKYVSQIVSAFRILPQGMVREKFRPSMEELKDVLATVQKGSPTRIAVVGTPPPKEGTNELREFLPAEPHFVNWAKSIGKPLDEVKITPSHIRLKLWYVLQQMVADTAKEAGAQFIPVAAEAMGDNGYLRREFWNADVTHANVEYGQVMLRKIVKDMS